MNTRSRYWRALAALAALLMLLAACGNDDNGNGDDPPDTVDDGDDPGGDDPGDDDAAGQEPQYGGTVIIGLEAEAGGYIPGLTATGTSSASVDGAVFDPLVVQTAEGEFEGFLAESIEPNDDLTEWTLTLREGVNFHDGTPLDADAILWNYENLHLHEESLTAGAMATAGLESVEVVDELTVRYVLNGANAAFPDLLAGRVGNPVSPTAYEEMGQDAFGSAPVGTGPFVAQSWVRDDEFVLTRNDDYWLTDENGNELPYLDEVIFRPIPDEEARYNSLRADDTQIIQTTRGQAGTRIIEAADEGGFESNVSQGNIQGASLFNIAFPPMDDIRVREAMILAASSDDIAAAQGYGELTEQASQFVSSDSPWFSTEAEAAFIGSGGQDLDAATARLQEYIDDPDRSDGRAPGDRLTIRYQCPPDPSLQDMVVVLQDVWQEIGVDLDLITVDQPTLIGNVIGSAENELLGDYDMTCWRVGTNDDPLQYVSNYFGPVESTVTNFVNWTDPEIDEELVTLRTSPDFAERYAALERINVIHNENAITAWHIAYASTIGWRDDLRNVSEWTTPEGSPGPSNLGGRIWVHYVWIDQ